MVLVVLLRMGAKDLTVAAEKAPASYLARHRAAFFIDHCYLFGSESYLCTVCWQFTNNCVLFTVYCDTFNVHWLVLPVYLFWSEVFLVQYLNYKKLNMKF